MASTRLVWKWEDGDEGTNEPPAGPAWIDTLDGNGKRTSTQNVAGGEWITRDTAIRLARENGHELLLDE